MTLEQLKARADELLNSINMTTNQVFVLQGHKNEVDYQIKLVAEEEKQEVLAIIDENPVV